MLKKFLVILLHIIGIICTALILPSFVTAVTTAILSLQPQRIVIFFMYPMMTSAGVAQTNGSAMGYLSMAQGYLMYAIAIAYTYYLIRKIIIWHHKAKLFDAK